MVTVPMVHLNGSGKRILVEQQLQPAVESLYKTIDAVRECAPHMRDYYPFPNSMDKFNAAVREHKARLEKLTDVLEELQELAILIDSQ